MSDVPCYIVILLDDEPQYAWSRPQRYILATRTTFPTYEIAEGYAEHCAESRKPIVVECPRGVDFRHLESTTPAPQKSGGVCKKCGGFTTYTRQNTHGLCLKCELEAKQNG